MNRSFLAVVVVFALAPTPSLAALVSFVDGPTTGSGAAIFLEGLGGATTGTPSGFEGATIDRINRYESFLDDFFLPDSTIPGTDVQPGAVWLGESATSEGVVTADAIFPIGYSPAFERVPGTTTASYPALKFANPTLPPLGGYDAWSGDPGYYGGSGTPWNSGWGGGWNWPTNSVGSGFRQSSGSRPFINTNRPHTPDNNQQNPPTGTNGNGSGSGEPNPNPTGLMNSSIVLGNNLLEAAQLNTVTPRGAFVDPATTPEPTTLLVFALIAVCGVIYIRRVKASAIAE